MRNIRPRIPIAQQQRELAALAELNRDHLERHDHDPALAARIRSFETAFGMQMAAPEAFDLSKETDETLALYGLPRGGTQGFAWQCLTARRLVERGVRFVELIDSGSSNNWDAHGDMIGQHAPLAKNVDRPIAGLLKDLKRRGLLEETLVVWTTEFGRTPFNNSADAKGREHHSWAFSSWLAGAGVKAGIVHGATDEYGIRVAENGVHVHDFHATILHLLGLDHTRLDLPPRRARFPADRCQRRGGQADPRLSAPVPLGPRLDHSDAYLMHTVFGSVKKRSASSPPSRPMPLCFTPPNGVRRSRSSQQFTQTVPLSICSATRCARPRSRVHSEADRPNGVLLAQRITSSSARKGAIVTTGPKISSWFTRQLGSRSMIAVG